MQGRKGSSNFDNLFNLENQHIITLVEYLTSFSFNIL